MLCDSTLEHHYWHLKQIVLFFNLQRTTIKSFMETFLQYIFKPCLTLNHVLWRKYPSGAEARKLKQEVLKRGSKMANLTAYLGHLTLSSLKRKSRVLFLLFILSVLDDISK
jgi:hypothetical protein